MPRPKGKSKIRINITLDKSVYKKLKKLRIPISTYINFLVRKSLQLGVSSEGLPKPATRVQIPATASQLTSDFTTWLRAKGLSKEYTTSLLNLLQKRGFSVYKNPKAIKTQWDLRLFYNILKFLEENGYITTEQAQALRRKANKPKSQPDRYVPTAGEVRGTLAQLPEKHRTIYKALLYSGIRASEMQYLIDNKGKLKATRKANYIKYLLNWSRGKKTAFFCYLPYPIAEKLPEKFKLTALQSYIKKHNLLPVKYLRKFFYTTAIQVAPSEIVDFIQGRTADSIGAKHYLQRELLADRFYPRIAKRIKGILTSLK